VRFGEFIVAVIVVVALLAVVRVALRAAWRAGLRRFGPARAKKELIAGNAMRVYVKHGYSSATVDEIPIDEDDYDERFAQAMAKARSIAATTNADRR
jgi:hypothetical protein